MDSKTESSLLGSAYGLAEFSGAQTKPARKEGLRRCKDCGGRLAGYNTSDTCYSRAACTVRAREKRRLERDTEEAASN